jgi:hypothetical protein
VIIACAELRDGHGSEDQDLRPGARAAMDKIIAVYRNSTVLDR